MCEPEKGVEPDIQADVLELGPEDVPDADVVWASPSCVNFSRANQYENWDDQGRPKNKDTVRSCRETLHAVWLIQEIDPDWWWLENPRGRMRGLLDEMLRPPATRVTITYCQYGMDYMKPTDLWGRHPPSFTPKRCSEGSPCHADNPNGGQALGVYERDSVNRSKVPKGLSEAVADAVENPGGSRQATVSEVMQRGE